MSLSSEYDRLLSIIDDEKENREKHHKKQPVKQTQNQEETVDKENNKKDVNSYKSLDINSYVNKPVNVSSKNTEFNIEKFKSNMRKKLISNYYRVREYERPYISITEILGCLRKVYYERMKYNVNDNELFNFPQLLVIQDCGNTIHKDIQDNYDFDETEKVLISEKYKLKGRIDAIKNKTAFEIKSLDPDEFKQITEIRENDYKQGIIYGFVLKNDYKYDIENLEVIYISRNLKDYIVLKTKIDFNYAEELVQTSLDLHDCITSSKPPLAYYNSEDNECKYCVFKKNCKSEDDSRSEVDNDKKKKINTFVLGD